MLNRGASLSLPGVVSLELKNFLRFLKLINRVMFYMPKNIIFMVARIALAEWFC